MTLTQAHRQWATRPADERFKSLSDLHSAVLNRRRGCQDGNIRMADVSFEVNGEMTMRGALGVSAKFTHWSAGQMLAKLGVPRDLLGKLSPNVASQVLNDRLARAFAEGEIDAKQRMLLHADADGQRTVRALHGQRYNRLWDSTVTATLLENLPSGWYNPVAYAAGKFGNSLEPSGLYAGDRSMFAFFVDGGDWTKQENRGTFDVDGEEFNHGFFVSNSEVGAETFTFMPFEFDRTCGNHYVWGVHQVAEFKARHVGRRASRLLDVFRRWLNEMGQPTVLAQRQSKFAAAVRNAKANVVVPVSHIVTAQAKLETLDLAFSTFKNSFTKSEITLALDAMLREEKDVTGTRYDWLAGFTAVARELPNADDRNALETKASSLFLALK